MSVHILHIIYMCVCVCVCVCVCRNILLFALYSNSHLIFHSIVNRFKLQAYLERMQKAVIVAYFAVLS
jgi:hypothetical protein